MSTLESSIEDVLDMRAPGRKRLVDPAHGLTEMQRRIAMMRSANISVVDISHWLGIDKVQVEEHTRNPRVIKLIMRLMASTSDDLGEKVKEVNEMIADSLVEAHEANMEVLSFTRRFMNPKMEGMVKPDTAIRAAALCANTAQDILDRAGASAPKVVEHKSMTVNLTGEDVDRISSALKELDEVESTPYVAEFVSLDKPSGDVQRDSAGKEANRVLEEVLSRVE